MDIVDNEYNLGGHYSASIGADLTIAVLPKVKLHNIITKCALKIKSGLLTAATEPGEMEKMLLHAQQVFNLSQYRLVKRCVHMGTPGWQFP